MGQQQHELQKCEHCGLECLAPVYEQEHVFCCIGCRGVYRLLNQQGLSHYYDLKKDGSTIRDATPVDTIDTKFNFLDADDFKKEYTRSNQFGQEQMSFYLEGVHCVACLWLIEKLPEFVPAVSKATLNLGTSVTTITLKEGGTFAQAAHALNQIGYRPHPLQNESDAQNLEKKENRSLLIKIAIAGACAGNIMLLAVSLYAGLKDGALAQYFRWLTFALSLPAILFSATPFYKSAIGSIKAKAVSIDFPIVLAIIIGSLSGLYNLIVGKEHIYFDSLTVLIFLLLSARYLLKIAQQSGLRASEVGHFFTAGAILKWNEDTQDFQEIHAKYLEIGDLIKVQPNEVIPCDGIIKKGESTINNSLLTGESDPVFVKKDFNVYSGTVNLDQPLEIEVTKVASETRLGKILKQVETQMNKKAPIATLTDKFSSIFVLTVLSLAAVMFIYLLTQGDFETAFDHALTLIIITCPCALGLATPLALTAATNKLSRRGTIIKGDNVIEKLSKAKYIFLDKTGTLTYGTFQVDSWQDLTTHPFTKAIVLTLEKRSRHPVAKALVQFIEENHYEEILEFQQQAPLVENFKESLGKGVSAEINSELWEVVALRETDLKLNTIGIYCNHQLISKITLKDRLRSDAHSAIEKIKKLGITPAIISGDVTSTVEEIARELDLDPKLIWSKTTPEQKSQIIGQYPEAIMVGDGANDALSLGQSFVGIAVQGSVEISLRVADVYLTSPGIGPIAHLLEVSKESMKVIYRNLLFSLIYNIIGVTLALMGLVTPLVAAILMPISSLTVISSTLIGTKKLRKS